MEDIYTLANPRTYLKKEEAHNGSNPFTMYFNTTRGITAAYFSWAAGGYRHADGILRINFDQQKGYSTLYLVRTAAHGSGCCPVCPRCNNHKTK